MSDQDRREQIKAALHRAFADVPYPGDDAIALYPDDRRGKPINEDFKGHPWRDVPLEVLHKHGHRFAFFSPEGRRFYLPAYLLRDLDQLQPKSAGSFALEALVPPDDLSRFTLEYDAYTPAQRDAIRRYLAYARDTASEGDAGHLARIALGRYWSTSEQEDVSTPPEPPESSRKAYVKQAIREAFADVPYPGDERIAYNEEGLYDLERMQTCQDFRGHPWRQVPRGVIRARYDSLPLLSAEGRHFYLPAYLLAALDTDDDIRQWVLYDLMPSTPGELEEWMKSRNDRLSPAQKAAVRSFLAYIHETSDEVIQREEAKSALGWYWGRARSHA